MDYGFIMDLFSTQPDPLTETNIRNRNERTFSETNESRIFLRFDDVSIHTLYSIFVYICGCLFQGKEKAFG